MNSILLVALLVALSCLIPTQSFFQNQKIPVKSIMNQVDEYGVPANGIIDYIGKSTSEKGLQPEESLVSLLINHSLPGSINLFITISRSIVQKHLDNHLLQNSIYFANYLGKKLAENLY